MPATVPDSARRTARAASVRGTRAAICGVISARASSANTWVRSSRSAARNRAALRRPAQKLKNVALCPLGSRFHATRRAMRARTGFLDEPTSFLVAAVP